MLKRDRAHEIFERIRKLSSADEVELIVSGGRSALTRFANNAITQNVAEENYDASLRVIFDGRTARASTNRFDDASMRRLVEQVESFAKVQQHDPDLLPLPTPEEAGGGPAPNRYVARTAAVDPGQRAEAVAGMVAVAKRERLTAAGTFAVSEQMEVLLNSRGVDLYHSQTLAEASITMLAESSSGWQKSNSSDIGEIDALRLAEKAAEKAKRSANPTELAAGKHTVILEPAAVLDPQHQKLIDQLNSSGDIDKDYVNMQVDAHNSAVSLFTDYSKNGTNESLKKFASDTLPILQEHQQHVEQIRSSLTTP